MPTLPPAVRLSAVASICLFSCWIAFANSLQSPCFAQVPVGELAAITASTVEAVPIPLKDLDGHFPMVVPETLDAWKARSEQVRQQLLVSLGLWPKPKMAPPKPTLYGTRELDGYSVSKVYFESLPGLFVTGSLYLPETNPDRLAKRPAILSPHGHWTDGRFYSATDKEVRQSLATGSERFESAARNHMQARCVHLARMGCVVFQYDMLGYADSQQISFDRAHRFGLAGPNPAVDPKQWLLYSPQAEGHSQSVMAIQTLNSLQAFEFLAQRADVDPNRIAITGASGGGTQSFIAAAIEPRIAGAFPAVMVSTGMQGGCTCENACGLRVGTGNVELAAMIAPRPQGLTAADDWTRTMAKDGFPELQKIYDLFGAKNQVSLTPNLHFGHNYNHVSRVGLYGFINKLFQLGHQEPVLERDFELLKREDLTVWDEKHIAPPSGTNFEASLLTGWAEDVRAQLNAAPELSAKAWDVLLGPANALASGLTLEKIRGDQQMQRIQIKNANGGIVAVFELPETAAGTPLDIELIAAPENQPKKHGATALLLNDPYALETGNEQPAVKNPRPAASYTYGYNPPLAVRRLAILLKILDELAPASRGDTKLTLHAEGPMTFFVLAAQRLRPKQISTNGSIDGFDFHTVDSIRHPMFIPGSLRYGPLK